MNTHSILDFIDIISNSMRYIYHIFCYKNRFKYNNLELIESVIYYIYQYFENKEIYLLNFIYIYKINQIYESYRYHLLMKTISRISISESSDFSIFIYIFSLSIFSSSIS